MLLSKKLECLKHSVSLALCDDRQDVDRTVGFGFVNAARDVSHDHQVWALIAGSYAFRLKSIRYETRLERKILGSALTLEPGRQRALVPCI